MKKVSASVNGFYISWNQNGRRKEQFYVTKHLQKLYFDEDEVRYISLQTFSNVNFSINVYSTLLPNSSRNQRKEHK